MLYEGESLWQKVFFYLNHINGNIAIDAGIYTFTLTKNGQEQEVQARYNFVYERQNDGEWLIINHHSSAMPEDMVDEPELMKNILIKEQG